MVQKHPSPCQAASDNVTFKLQVSAVIDLSIIMLPASELALIAAPMVNQSDLPFRLLVRKYGGSLAFTQEC